MFFFLDKLTAAPCILASAINPFTAVTDPKIISSARDAPFLMSLHWPDINSPLIKTLHSRHPHHMSDPLCTQNTAASPSTCHQGLLDVARIRLKLKSDCTFAFVTPRQ